MILLPRGNPVKEKVNPARVNLPEAMDKLRGGSFTGYLKFDSPEGTGVIIFEKGKLVSALFLPPDEEKRLIAYDAIVKIFEISILGQTVLNIYRLSCELAMSVHALLHGEYIYKGQELKLVDIGGLLAKIKNEAINGCLRIYAEDRIALIFYENGNSLGFFHDGSTDLETTADTSMSVAALPGAKVDLVVTCSPEELMLADLMASADLGPMWQRARKTLLDERRQEERMANLSREEQQEARRQRILSMLRGIAERHIGKFGVTQVEKAYDQVGLGLKPEDFDKFYKTMAQLAKLVAGPSKINAMIEEMTNGVRAIK